jgi:hypothetical protein
VTATLSRQAINTPRVRRSVRIAKSFLDALDQSDVAAPCAAGEAAKILGLLILL